MTAHERRYRQYLKAHRNGLLARRCPRKSRRGKAARAFRPTTYSTKLAYLLGEQGHSAFQSGEGL